MANLLGIDFGTTALKACLFNDKGERLTDRSVRYELITNGEFIEFPTERFFEIIVQVISDIKREYKIDALAIDTQGETLIVLDKEENKYRVNEKKYKSKVESLSSFIKVKKSSLKK